MAKDLSMGGQIRMMCMAGEVKIGYAVMLDGLWLCYRTNNPNL